MKQTCAFLVVLLYGLIAVYDVNAQGKAFEEVYYTAQLNSGIIQLMYADGYLAGSTIRIIRNKKHRLFLPESGASGDNGDLKFIPAKTAAKADYIILKNADRQAGDPLTLHAIT